MRDRKERAGERKVFVIGLVSNQCQTATVIDSRVCCVLHFKQAGKVWDSELG